MPQVHAQRLLLSSLESLAQVVQALLLLVTRGRGATPVCPSVALTAGERGYFSSSLTERRSDNLSGLDRASNGKRMKLFCCHFSFLPLITVHHPHKSALDGIQLRQHLQVRLERHHRFFRCSHTLLIPLLVQARISLRLLFPLRPLLSLLVVANAQALQTSLQASVKCSLLVNRWQSYRIPGA